MKTITKDFNWQEYLDDIEPFVDDNSESPIKKWVEVKGHGKTNGKIITNKSNRLFACFVGYSDEPVFAMNENLVIKETVFEKGDFISHIGHHCIAIYDGKTDYGFNTIAAICSKKSDVTAEIKYDLDIYCGFEIDESEFRIANDKERAVLCQKLDDNGYFYDCVDKTLLVEEVDEEITNEPTEEEQTEGEDEFDINSVPSNKKVLLEMKLCKMNNNKVVTSTYGDDDFQKDMNEMYILTDWAVIIDGEMMHHKDYFPLNERKKLEDGTVLVDRTTGRMFLYSHANDLQKMPMSFESDALWVTADYITSKGLWCEVSPNKPYKILLNNISNIKRENLEFARPYEIDRFYEAIIQRGYTAIKIENKILNITYNRNSK